jgi:hypothetical protein
MGNAGRANGGIKEEAYDRGCGVDGRTIDRVRANDKGMREGYWWSRYNRQPGIGKKHTEAQN